MVLCVEERMNKERIKQIYLYLYHGHWPQTRPTVAELDVI